MIIKVDKDGVVQIKDLEVLKSISGGKKPKKPPGGFNAICAPNETQCDLNYECGKGGAV